MDYTANPRAARFIHPVTVATINAMNSQQLEQMKAAALAEIVLCQSSGQVRRAQAISYEIQLINYRLS